MTLAEIVDQVYHRCRAIDGIDQLPIRESVNIWYRWIHRQLMIQEALVSDSFTWATTDTADKDVSTVLTNWRGKPQWVTSADEDYEWARRSILEVRRRRTGDDPDNYYSGHFVYAVRGDYLMIVEAPDSALTVTVVHYQYPPELDDLTDEPLLPTDFHDMLASAAVAETWGYARTMAGRAFEANVAQAEQTKAEQEFHDAWKSLVVHVRKEMGVKHEMKPGPLFKAAADQIARRRGY